MVITNALSASIIGRMKVVILGSLNPINGWRCSLSISRVFLFADIASHFKGANDLSVGIMNGRDNDEDFDKSAVFMRPYRLKGLPPQALANS